MEALKKHGIDLGLLFMRVSISLSMLVAHGIGKMTKFSVIAPNFPDPIGLGGTTSLALAVFGEVVCPALIILGIKTRLAAIPAAITMFVAAVVVHASDPWKVKELAFIYLFAFIAMILTGGGKYSIKE